MTQNHLNKTLLHKRVFLGPRALADHAKDLPDCEYIITGCLLNESGSLRVGLMSMSFSPANKQWYDVSFCSSCVQHLDEAFIVEGDYDPIDHHVLYWFGEATQDAPAGPPLLRTLWLKGSPDEVQTDDRIAQTANSNDVVYHMTWTTTDGTQISRAWMMEPTQFEDKTDDEIREMVGWSFGSWVRSGNYYHTESPQL